ncbi:MAG: orotidine 5'-phosphate decarboxylase [Gammaproteobacteria bacterium RIFCSPHIGHO2_12_FULL_45_12]|nr:MAG: orotidine 5'-phosphate decarboxylase [Gammaproteobacteria bacterium RIFCSPHIGHO2_12_FULL_45_12]
MISSLTYAKRANTCPAPLASHLFNLMDSKQTNLCVAADVNSAPELLALADEIGSEICLLKTHIDMLADITPTFYPQLNALAKKHDFLIFEDRKFADIGNTVKRQYEGGSFCIADWAHIINAHSLPGPGILQGLQTVGLPKGRGLFLLAEMSSAGNLLDEAYVHKTLAMAKLFPEFVIGFITQHGISPEPHWINATPGVQLNISTDSFHQQYVTPETAILDNGTDIIIVGRGILTANHPLKTARQYKKRGWDAYLARTR